MTDRLLEHKKTGKPGVHALFARGRSRSALVEAIAEDEGTVITRDYVSDTPRAEIITGVRGVYALD